MTPMNDPHEFSRHRTSTVPTPRLRLKAKAPQTGYVDGAWWPHSDALSTELPDLLAVLSVRLGPIDRVLYRVGEWSSPAASSLAFGERSVRLDGYRHQPPHSVEILGLNRRRITLLVVPPGADPDDAHAVMMAAAFPQDASTVSDLLMSNSRDQETRLPRAGADQERWESDGGTSRTPTLVGLSGMSTRS